MSESSEDPHDLTRFLDAQAVHYENAIRELRSGRKQSHWIWFVLPQLRGLGSSPNAERYGIRSQEEASAYLAHPTLGHRLRECVEALTALPAVSAAAVLGDLDAMKLCSCLTLFAAVADDASVFEVALQRYFAGQPDQKTLQVLARSNECAE